MLKKRIGVLSVGNVLMGDDGVGPYILKILESLYEFPAEVVLDVPRLRATPIAPSIWRSDRLTSKLEEGVSAYVSGDPR